MTDTPFPQALDDQSLGICFIGGCGEFGMNMTLYVYQSRIYMVDCGIAFADDHELGIDAHIPEIDDLIHAYGGIAAYFITHGHEDHVGALPYYLQKWPAPVYATAWTLEILKDRLERQNLSISQFDVRTVRAGDQIVTGPVRSHWIHIPHSIPQCCSLWLEFDDQRVFHTGDFKMDPTPPQEPGPDWQSIQKAGRTGCDLLVADSTNAPKSGMCPSETSVVEPLAQVIQQARQMVVLTTFSSNFWRLKTVIDLAKQAGRYVHISGAGIHKCLAIATELGLFEGDRELFIEAEALSKLPRDKVLVLASGSQGEHRSGLKRLVADEMNHLKLRTGDTLILSSRTIPGNEKSVFKMISECHAKRVHVVSPYDVPGIHVSGHAYQEDLRLLIEALAPTIYIPVHGTFTQLMANAQLAPNNQVLHVENGTTMVLKNGKLLSQQTFDWPIQYVDSWSRRPMSYDTLRARLKIGDSGMLLVSGWLDPHKPQRQQIDIESIGLPFHNQLELEEWRSAAASKVRLLLKQAPRHPDAEWVAAINEEIRRELRRSLAQKFVKKPVVLSRVYLSQKG
jgi:ribonuclease J